MKIVSFGEVHMAIDLMKKIALELSTADLLILSGDLTNFGGVADTTKALTAARNYCSAVLALPGSPDRPEVIGFLRAEQVALHGESRRIGQLGLFGDGGSNITPFHTPLEYRDTQLGEVLSQTVAAVADAPLQLMVCHTPPCATAPDRPTNGTPGGV